MVAEAVSAVNPRTDTVLDVRGLSKSFPGVQAVSAVDLSVKRGEVVAVVGENGAGKSTLMKIIAGVYPADSYEGELLIDGVVGQFKTVRDAEAAGVVLVPQELYIAPGLSIAENMFMGRLPGARGFVDQASLHRMAADGLRFFGIKVSTDAPAGILSPSEQRLVIIASALAKSAKLIILDEPTAALTEEETTRLFAHVRRVQKEGLGCVYITHRLDEIEQIADRVVVMRNGRVVANFDSGKGHRSEIVRAMIGRDPEGISGGGEIGAARRADHEGLEPPPVRSARHSPDARGRRQPDAPSRRDPRALRPGRRRAHGACPGYIRCLAGRQGRKPRDRRARRPAAFAA